ncbi:MAG: excinuclease ABC subunit UvrC [Candidatus Coatesbacteria bacterium]|nr:excinuclease ABC subunit UvrC [Candidatus Coatesbacteria bacterium]
MTRDHAETGAFRDKLTDLPSEPGVYIMSDAAGEVIYVGKAKNLRHRLRSYLHPERSGTKVKALVQNVHDVDYIVTANELEALILESNLVKEKKPRYNIELKDDKHYPYLKITSEPFPRLQIVRRFKRDDARYFGPFVPTHAIRTTLKLIYKIFKVRSCKRELPTDRKDVPCLNHQMKRCLAPCIGKVTPEDYLAIIDQIVMFLEGRSNDLVKDLTDRMETAAQKLEYERAAVLRDQIAAIEKVQVKQKITLPEYCDKDVIGISLSERAVAIQVFFLRGGLIKGHEEFMFNRLIELSKDEVASGFVKQYYLTRLTPIPEEILVPYEIADGELISELLTKKQGRKVSIAVPQRGSRRNLMTMAKRNAEQYLNSQLEDVATGSGRAVPVGALDLGRRLGLDKRIERVDVFDNSILFGSWGVGTMIVWQENRFEKSEYRRYTIKSETVIDDVGMMSEVLSRRYSRAKSEGTQLPEVVLIDGGKAQLNIAAKVLSELGLEQLKVLGIAKARGREGIPDDIIYVHSESDPLDLEPGSEALLFLKKIRDEAHRFAIAFHRGKRRKETLRSDLLKVPGIGEKRLKDLLREFGSLKSLRAASLPDLESSKALDKSTAGMLFDFLHVGPDNQIDIRRMD